MIRRAAPLLLLALLYGCATPVNEIGKPPKMSPVGSGIDETTGSISSYPDAPSSRAGRFSLWDDRQSRLFTDPRALRPGDILTVEISIDDRARFKNESERNRKTSRELGFDWKYLTSNLFFAGDIEEVSPVANQYMTITQFLLGYRLQRNWTENLLSFRIDMMLSPWQDWWFPHQTPSEYDSLRAGSHVRYAYWKASIADIHKTSGKWTLSGLVRGQLATGTLPTAEQFGLGGANTVRGYYEQQFIADNAICINFEVYTPPFGLFKTKTLRNELSFVAFVDYGYGYNYSVVAPEFREQHLIGIGPGLRYDISTYFSLKLDYGFQLKGITGDSQFGRLNFSAIASY